MLLFPGSRKVAGQTVARSSNPWPKTPRSAMASWRPIHPRGPNTIPCMQPELSERLYPKQGVLLIAGGGEKWDQTRRGRSWVAPGHSREDPVRPSPWTPSLLLPPSSPLTQQVLTLYSQMPSAHVEHSTGDRLPLTSRMWLLNESRKHEFDNLRAERDSNTQPFWGYP